MRARQATERMESLVEGSNERAVDLGAGDGDEGAVVAEEEALPRQLSSQVPTLLRA